MSCIQERINGADKDFCRDLCCPVCFPDPYFCKRNKLWHKHCTKVCGLNVQNAGDKKGDKPGIPVTSAITHLETAWTQSLTVCKV